MQEIASTDAATNDAANTATTPTNGQLPPLMRTALLLSIVALVLGIAALSLWIGTKLSFPVSVLEMALIAIFLRFAITPYFRVTDRCLGRAPAFFLALLFMANVFSVVGILVEPQAKPQLLALADAAPKQVPILWQEVRPLIAKHDPSSAVAVDTWIQAHTSTPELFELAKGFLSSAPRFVGSVFSGLGYGFITMILFLTILEERSPHGVYQQEQYITWIASRFPRQRQKVEAVLIRTRDDVGHWAWAQFFVSSLLGITFGFSLWLLGLPFAIAIGVLTMFVDMVPYGNLAALALGVIGLITDLPNHDLYENLTHVVVVVVVWLGLTQVKDNLISPRIMNRVLHLHPFFIMTFAIGGFTMDGVMGAILSMPVLLFCRAVEVEFYGTRILTGQRKPFCKQWLGRALLGAWRRTKRVWFIMCKWRPR